MKKHAYLIIAHCEFKILQYLLMALDDPRNDVYIHFDKKVKDTPHLDIGQSKLYILDSRVDVRWGTISQISAEYLLFEEAYTNQQEYDRYHLISGTHLPLKNQDRIHTFFNAHSQVEILSYLDTNNYEINLKLRQYHLFSKYFVSNLPLIKKTFGLFWHICLRLQYILRIKKPPINVSLKANNWVSLTNDAVGLLLEYKNHILLRFKWSFCGDEFFVPYLLQNNTEKISMKNEKHLLYSVFGRANVRNLTINDRKHLLNSEYLFARKFSEQEMDIVHLVMNEILPKK